MKNIFIKVVIFLSLLCEISGMDKKARCGLELLWDYADKKNYEIVIARLNENTAARNSKDYWKKKIPSVSTTTSYSFDSRFSDSSESEFQTSVSISEEFYNGTGILINPIFSLSKDLSELSVERQYSNILDSFEFEIGFYQNLYPYWMQGYKENPDKKSSLLKQKEAECLLKIEKRNCFEQIAGIYIEYRELIRNLDCLQDYLVYLNDKKKVFGELKTKREISSVELSEMDDEIQTCFSKYLEYTKTRDNLKNQIFEKIGFSSEDVEDFENINFLDELPLDAVYEKINPDVEYFMIQKEILLNDYIMTRQNNAPVAKLGMSFPLYKRKSDSLFDFLGDSNTWNINFSVEFDYETFQNKRKKLDYSEWNEVYEHKIDAVKMNVNFERDFYSKRLKEVEKIFKFYENLLHEKESILDAMEKLFEKKECNLLDLTEARLNQKNVLIQMENLRDEKWYYSWMKQNRN